MAEFATNPETPNTTPEVDLSGRKLGDYQLLRRLGRGGMAEVWLAEQVALKRQVAIKVLRSDLSTDDMYIKRFRIEAQAAAQLVHAHIVQIHDVGCIEGIHYIAQEYVQGQNLREYMVKHGPPELKLSVSIIRQVASALHKASEAGIVHRDIKPDNIMLTRAGEVKVADFGLARISGDGEGLNLTRVGMTMGTPLYMSPEQVEGRVLDSRSDIYSFGVTCYHMLAGSPPFRGETALSVAVQHLKSRPEPLESIRPDLPSGLCRIVHKMLSKEPGQRHAAPREILRELRNLQIEGLDDDWSESIDLIGPADERSSAAHRLGHLMKTEAMIIPPRAPWKLISALVLTAFLIGGLMAWALEDRSLLAGADPQKTAIPKQATVREQYFLAVHLNSERGWRSVLEHYPEEKEYTRLATQQLARWHLRHNEYEQALKLFGELADLHDTQEDVRAFGLAGKWIVLMFQNKNDKASEVLVELTPKLKYLTDSQMRQTLGDVLEANRDRMASEDAKDFQKMLSESLDRDEN